MINTVIVEDNLYIKNHLENMVIKDEQLELISSVRDSFDAEKLCKSLKVDLVLMDVQTLHNHSGLSSAERIKQNSPDTKVIIVTSLIDPEVLKKAKLGAADSLWYKDHGDDDLLSVITRTLAGERVFPDVSPTVELKEMFSSDISPRQMEILRYFVRGLTYDEIAGKLGITKNGVRWNLEQIVEKGGFENKHELLAALIENKLIVTTLKDE